MLDEAVQSTQARDAAAPAARPRRPHFKGYGAAFASVALVFGVRILLTPILGDDSPYLLFVPAALLAAGVGGFGPGVVATILSVALAISFVAGIPGSLAEVINAATFIAIGIGMAWGGELLHRSRISATASTRDILAQRAHLQSMRRDTAPLSDHATYLANKITFLLDAMLGVVNIEQNAIIKIFSIAAVVFMPPTLVASIYGMNFHHGMIELDWTFGYPFALFLIVVAAVVPLAIFKWKKWL